MARGYELLGHYAEQTGIPVEHTGALLVAWTDEEPDALPGLKDKAERNFYHRCEIVEPTRFTAEFRTWAPEYWAG